MVFLGVMGSPIEKAKSNFSGQAPIQEIDQKIDQKNEPANVQAPDRATEQAADHATDQEVGQEITPVDEDARSYTPVSENQFLKRIDPEKATHQINIRIINHGEPLKPWTLDAQLKSAETIFSQCPGATVKLNIISQIDLEPTTSGENLVVFNGFEQWLKGDFEEFFRPALRGRDFLNTIDVHITGYLDENARIEHQTKGTISQLALGKAFTRATIDWFYLSERPGDEKFRLAQDTLILSKETLEYAETRKYKMKIDGKLRSASAFKSSLLAHELGHILMDPQSKETHSIYTDHFCPDINDFCPRSNLMSGGGYTNYEFKLGFFKKGYSPLPNLEKGQCDLLTQHYLVKRAESP
jgi:hypothetical protein